MSTLLWQPSDTHIQQSQLYQFMRTINQTHNQNLNDYAMLHQWSVKHTADFWKEVWQQCGVISKKNAATIHQPGNHMLNSTWFEGAELNFAENCLNQTDHHIAIIETNENNHTRLIRNAELKQSVRNVAAYLRNIGVTNQDCVAACLPNKTSAIIAMLACSSIGATFSSCAPEFGYESTLDRLLLIKPAVLFATLNHTYHGKQHRHADKIKRLNEHLNLKKLIIDDNEPDTTNGAQIKNSIFMHDIPECKQPLIYSSLPFNHPLFILFSSGTTGQPKCIVHGTGGTLLQHKKEHQLHCDIKPGDRLFFHTTTGWMMWNWLVSGLASGATIVCYDGSPTFPTSDRLFSLVEQFSITHFGLGAKLLEHMEQREANPRKNYHLGSLKNLLTTGSPLLPSSFDYVYRHVKEDICLSSISGGTDIISCFALGNPMLPVYRGQLQCAGLGMDVRVLNEEGTAVIGEKGELTCQTPFPSMPIYFLDDTDRSRYKHAYFQRFDNIWAQSDYAIATKEGGLIILGRSDTTLNPNGIRIGTAEIYRALSHINDIGDSIAVSLQTTEGEKVILFIQDSPTLTLNLDKIQQIKLRIKQHASPHHVPAYIYTAPDLPRTLNGKLAEKAVQQTLAGEKTHNTNALLNPESLEFFKTFQL